MGFSALARVALPLGLLILLAACQTGPNPRSYGQTAGYSPAQYGCGGYPCGRAPAPRLCPPGHILKRAAYPCGGSKRYCVPYYPRWSRCCGSPPVHYGPPAGQCGGGYPRARY